MAGASVNKSPPTSTYLRVVLRQPTVITFKTPDFTALTLPGPSRRIRDFTSIDSPGLITIIVRSKSVTDSTAPDIHNLVAAVRPSGPA